MMRVYGSVAETVELDGTAPPSSVFIILQDRPSAGIRRERRRAGMQAQMVPLVLFSGTFLLYEFSPF